MWAVGNSCNRSNWQLTTLKQSRNILRLIATLSVLKRTFANSNFKRLVSGTQPPKFQVDISRAVCKMVTRYAARTNPDLDKTTLEDGVADFMKKIGHGVSSDVPSNFAPIDRSVSKYLWKSDRKLKVTKVTKGLEFCLILNAVIRDDIHEEIGHAITIMHSIMPRRVHNPPCPDWHHFPAGGETWRGAGFRDCFRPFFENIKGGDFHLKANPNLNPNPNLNLNLQTTSTAYQGSCQHHQ